MRMTPLTIEQAFNLALQHHQAGRLREAEELYRRILERQPDNFVALINLSNALKAGGKLDEAISTARQAIALNGEIAVAHVNLASALIGKGEFDEAIAAARRAIAINPSIAEAHINLANALIERGRFDDAAAAARQGIAVNANLPEAHYNLANALIGKGHLDDAVAAYRQAIALRPHYPQALSNLASALIDQRQPDAAIAAAQQAIAIHPAYAEAHVNLGNALVDKDQLEQAIAAYRRAIALDPGLAEAHINLGNALTATGQLDSAIASYRKGIALKPDNADAHLNLAMALLHLDLKEGWPEYDWRWKTRGNSSPISRFSQPLWDGADLNGLTILIHTEQGFGDTLQFFRYVPLVAGRGGRVIFEAPAELLRLLRQSSGVDHWLTRGDPLPAFDVQCPLLVLPRLFGTTLQNIPTPTEPLRAAPELLEIWRRRLDDKSTGLKIALAWAGSPTFKGDRTRSLSLDRLSPLAAVPNVTFYAVQKGPPAEQAANPPCGLRLVNLSPELNDFADTAAVMCRMDLVLTTDTSIAHLAGAMGLPVWVMLQFMPDWRWMRHREDSPWYPTMRLFRQNKPGDWEDVIRRVAAALSRFPSPGTPGEG
jgi:tetratricopeptide (TPR) repeat protein